MDVAKKYHLQVFEGEKKISTAAYPSTFQIEPVRFSPLPDDSTIFYFEVCHTEVRTPGALLCHYNFNTFSVEYPKSEFVLKLIIEPSSKLRPSLVMSVDVKVFYSDGSLFKNYQSQSDIQVDQMSSIAFETITNKVYSGSEFQRVGDSRCSRYSDHSKKMSNGDLTLKCKMFFNDDNPKSALECKTVPGSSNISHNLKSVYESSVFKDFVFNVGDKSFPVHKVILVAHSPVFMKMMTQDCLESKTSSVTITDATPEVFDVFLKYLYSGGIEDKSWSIVKDLYCLADKYDVRILKKDCTDISISLICVDLVCEVLKLAYTYDDSNLKSAAKNFAVNHIKELMSREDWNNLVTMHPVIGYEIIIKFVPK